MSYLHDIATSFHKWKVFLHAHLLQTYNYIMTYNVDLWLMLDTMAWQVLCNHNIIPNVFSVEVSSIILSTYMMVSFQRKHATIKICDKLWLVENSTLHNLCAPDPINGQSQNERRIMLAWYATKKLSYVMSIEWLIRDNSYYKQCGYKCS